MASSLALQESADEECTELFASSNDNDGFMMPEAWHTAWECHVSVRTGLRLLAFPLFVQTLAK